MLLSPPVLALLTVGVLATHGCSQPTPTAIVPPNTAPVTSPSVQQPYTRLLSATTSGFTESGEMVLRTNTELDAAWKTVHAGIPGNPPPAVDLTQNMVVVLALGQKRTGGYSVRFDSVTREGTGAVVHYTVTSPGPGCMTTQMITSPVDAVSIPRVDGTVRFEKSDIVEKC